MAWCTSGKESKGLFFNQKIQPTNRRKGLEEIATHLGINNKGGPISCISWNNNNSEEDLKTNSKELLHHHCAY